MMDFARLRGLTEDDFQRELRDVEQKGMKIHIDEVFRERCDGWSPLSFCCWAHHGLEDGGDYPILTYQDNDTEIEDGITLSHFALTNNGIVVAVGYDKKSNEIYYRVE